ncbi:hypothetical protein PCASD_24396, partial [Puccinia coronata f. sp. avenae]
MLSHQASRSSWSPCGSADETNEKVGAARLKGTMSVNSLGTVHQLRRFSNGLSRNRGIRSLKQRKEIPQTSRRRALNSSRNYSVVEIYPTAASSLSLETHSSAPAHLTNESIPHHASETDLAHEKVENWSSRAYAHLPFRPDFTLFEPVEATADNTSRNKTHDHNVLDLKSRLDTSLSKRLVYLIRDDLNAAEQLRTEIIKNGINLPMNLQITSHCFDLLFQANNISAYLDWLPLVAACHLQQASSLDVRPPIPICELHLNHILKVTPLELPSILKFVEILIAKECYSRHLGFAVIKHLVRTQTSATTISMTRKICSMIKQQASSVESIKSCYDFLVVQLANQGHLTEALQILYSPSQQTDIDRTSGLPKSYPLTYQVLADQLVARIKSESSSSSQHWSRELDQLVSRWCAVHQPSLRAWRARNPQCLKSLNLPSLTKQISKKYARVFNNASAVNPQVCQQISSEKLDQFTSYFRSLFCQNDHPKFVKAAQLANEIHQILPLRNSFQSLQANLELCGGSGHQEGTEEQIIKSFVLEPPAQFRFKSDLPISQISTRMCPKIAFEMRSDIVFLWAHSWMIFYHRSGQPRRAIQIFLDYFIPIGCDVKLINQIRWGPNGDGSPSMKRSQEFKSSHTPANDPKYQKLIHPTLGVLTVLYDAILSICPPKLISVVFNSFLAHHFPQPSEISSRIPSTSQKRLAPNMGSFRPFVRAYLRAKDVDGALKILESMHTHLDKLVDKKRGIQDEGGWIDLLEWCAVHSAGPQPKVFDPNYQWGAQRKRKINGWDGKMKEELIYLILQKFFLLKFTSAPLSNHHPHHSGGSFLEESTPNSDTHAGSWCGGNSQMDRLLAGLKIFHIKNPVIESKLAFLDHQKLPPSILSSTLSLGCFPTLKLMTKLKFGFYLAKNSNGLKIVKQGRTAQTLLRPGPDLSPLDWDKIRNFKTANNNKSINRMRFTIPSSDSDSDSEQEQEKEQRKDIKTANQKRSSWVTRSHSLSKPNTYTPKYSSNDSEGPYSTPAKPSKSFLSRSLNASSTGSNKKNHKLKLS